MLDQKLLLEPSSAIESQGEIGGIYTLFTDSRGPQKGNCFLALDGPNFKGVHFLADCVKNQTKLVIVNNDEESRNAVKRNAPSGVIYVKDTLLYLQELASIYLTHWKKVFGGQVIGITGSNGKTTVKEMLWHLLREVVGEAVWGSEKNFNNHIGVSLTVLGLKGHHRFLVLEMGTNHPGEIDRLCQIAPPDVGLITNIGDSHLEFFGDRAGVFAEKKALYQTVRNSNGPFLINIDDPCLKGLEIYTLSSTFGEKGGDFSLTLAQGRGELNFKGKSIFLENPRLVGNFNFFNMGMSAALLFMLFPTQEKKIVQGIKSFIPPANNRSCWVRRKGREIFLDAYNANPSSMREALEFFISQLGPGEKALFILGDMNELGPGAELFHREIGAMITRVPGDAVFIGHFAKEYGQGFARKAHCYQDLPSFIQHWPSFYEGYKKFFIKGSRSLQLESLLDIT